MSLARRILPVMFALISLLPEFSNAQGGLLSVDVPGATETDCNGINRSGVVVGYYVDSGGANHGFALVGKVFKYFDVLGAEGTFIYGINDSNQAVGWYVDGKFVTHGFLYNAGKVTTLDPPGSTLTNAWSINNAGTIVGTFVDGSGLHQRTQRHSHRDHGHQ